MIQKLVPVKVFKNPKDILLFAVYVGRINNKTYESLF